ncbi:MAG: prepilin peptidase [Bradymonadales bacterium]|jgi:leader peptidase (prepilin peptidase)/N-methyltransferase
MELLNSNAFLALIIFFCSLFSAAMGSFCNVVIYRIPAKRSILWPPSSCPNCETPIKAYDNIPILSWLILGGKCRQCKTKISVQYPVVEFVTMVLGTALALQIFLPRFAYLHSVEELALLLMAFFFLFLLVFACIALMLIDLKYTELPPEICYPFALLGILFAYLLPERYPFADLVGNIAVLDALLGALFGAGIVFLIIAFYYLCTKRIGMGGGDIGMMAMVGAFLGWQSLAFIFLAASLQGIVAAALGIVFGKKQQKKHEEFALFRNEVLKNDVDGTENSKEEENFPSEEGSIRTLALPFGPFIALAAIEYLFIAPWALKIMTGGALSPWGFVGFWPL